MIKHLKRQQTLVDLLNQVRCPVCDGIMRQMHIPFTWLHSDFQKMVLLDDLKYVGVECTECLVLDIHFYS